MPPHSDPSEPAAVIEKLGITDKDLDLAATVVDVATVGVVLAAVGAEAVQVVEHADSRVALAVADLDHQLSRVLADNSVDPAFVLDVAIPVSVGISIDVDVSVTSMILLLSGVGC